MKLIILTGQLGSGKTTILNNVVNTLPKIKTSIIINEFAVIGVDKESFSKKKVHEVNAGCVCCSKGDELVNTINKLKETSDLCLLETTGLASLSQLLKVVARAKVKISNVALVIDAYAFSKSKGLSQITKKQIENANTIIINKADIVSQSIINELKKIIGSKKDIIIGKKGKITYDQLKKEYEININTKKSFIKKIFPEYAEDAESRHIQKSGIKSISYKTNKSVSKIELENFISSLPKTITRAKGMINDDRDTFKFQYASGLFYIEKSSKPIKESSVVLIGKMNRFEKLNYIGLLDGLFNDKTKISDKLKSFLE